MVSNYIILARKCIAPMPLCGCTCSIDTVVVEHFEVDPAKTAGTVPNQEFRQSWPKNDIMC
jgi:hypothetical protein